MCNGVSMSPLSLRALSRGARRRSALVPLLISAPLALAALPAAAQAGSVTLDDWGCSGNEWTVPAGVTSIRLVAQGERGGNSGGYGARITGSVAVTPGTVLYACVGVGGGDGGTGAGGTGGGGGGYTSISSHADGSIPWIVAAGGGGNGAGPSAGSGGAAGTANTEASSGVASGAAGGGVRTDGTRGGLGGVNSADAAANGTAGLRAVGGTGGNSVGGLGAGGGGGGAGIWGGGGGAGSATSEDGSGGGGGGYSFCGSGTTGCASTNDPASPSVELSWADPAVATTTTVSLGTPRAIATAQVTLRAVVSPVPSGGTVAFTVDGGTQWNCTAVAVDTTTGAAECETNVPGERGSHSIRAVYSGVSDAFEGSDDDESFTVYSGVPSISPTPTADFGDVELGKSATRPFTVTNIGDADLTVDSVDGIYLAEYEPYSMPPRSTEYTAADDQCSGRVLAVGASCVVVVKYTPSALGEQTGVLWLDTDSWDGVDPVRLTGVGIEARPEPEPQPEERKPETPATPTTPTTPQTPVTPQTPAAPVQTPSAPVAPVSRPIGASANIGGGGGAQVTQSGGVRLPLVCPPGQACRVSGTLTLAITGGQARASATKTRVLLSFNGIKIAAGSTKTLSLRLPASFVKEQQAKGVRKLRTTLTVTTTLGSGRTVTRRQAITLLIPRARVAQRAAPQTPQRPSFTG